MEKMESKKIISSEDFSVLKLESEIKPQTPSKPLRVFLECVVSSILAFGTYKITFSASQILNLSYGLGMIAFGISMVAFLYLRGQQQQDLKVDSTKKILETDLPEKKDSTDVIVDGKTPTSDSISKDIKDHEVKDVQKTTEEFALKAKEMETVIQQNKEIQTLQKTIETESPKIEDTKTDSIQVEKPLIDYSSVIKSTPPFTEYKITFPPEHPCYKAGLKCTTVRPANLFLRELLKGTHISVTEPIPNTPMGANLFAFSSQYDLRKHILAKAETDEVLVFSAKGVKGQVSVPDKANPGKFTLLDYDMGEVFGENTFKISFKQIKAILDSQKIYTSSMMPLKFYDALKRAMKIERVIILPNPLLKNYTGEHVLKLIADVKMDPLSYGFKTVEDFNQMLDLSMYQIGSMVVKSEDFYYFVDKDCKIKLREPNQKDAIRLISVSGIRDFKSSAINQRILTETFKTMLASAEDGLIVIPAVGMGVWGGDPKVYWQALFDAIVQCGDKVEKIFVNPNPKSKVFGEIFHQLHKGNPAAMRNLEKVVDLTYDKTDVVLLVENLKGAYPDKKVCLVNASDPDVTLGGHVGEYVNYISASSVTEENYTAAGTNGICFEGVTDVLYDDSRRIQVTN